MKVYGKKLSQTKAASAPSSSNDGLFDSVVRQETAGNGSRSSSGGGAHSVFDFPEFEPEDEGAEVETVGLKPSDSRQNKAAPIASDNPSAVAKAQRRDEGSLRDDDAGVRPMRSTAMDFVRLMKQKGLASAPPAASPVPAAGSSAPFVPVIRKQPASFAAGPGATSAMAPTMRHPSLASSSSLSSLSSSSSSSSAASLAPKPKPLSLSLSEGRREASVVPLAKSVSATPASSALASHAGASQSTTGKKTLPAAPRGARRSELSSLDFPDDEGNSNDSTGSDRRRSEHPSSQESQTSSPSKRQSVKRAATWPSSDTGVDSGSTRRLKFKPDSQEAGASGGMVLVRDVLDAFESRESGASQQFIDDLEYMLEGMKLSQPLGVRCISVCTLINQALNPDFRIHFRALGAIAKVAELLKDAALHTELALCTVTLVAVLLDDTSDSGASEEMVSTIASILSASIAKFLAPASSGASSKPALSAPSTAAPFSPLKGSVTPRVRDKVAAFLRTLPDIPSDCKGSPAVLPLALFCASKIGALHSLSFPAQQLLKTPRVLDAVVSLFVQLVESEQARLGSRGSIVDAPPSPPTLWMMTTSLRILESASFMTDDVKAHLALSAEATLDDSHSSPERSPQPSPLLHSLVACLRLLLSATEVLEHDLDLAQSRRGPRAKAGAAPSAGSVRTHRLLSPPLVGLALGIVRLLVNLTNNHSRACLGLSTVEGAIEAIVCVALFLPALVELGDESDAGRGGGRASSRPGPRAFASEGPSVAARSAERFDTRVLGLVLLTNLAEHTWRNRDTLGLFTLTSKQMALLSPELHGFTGGMAPKEIAASESHLLIRALFRQFVHRERGSPEARGDTSGDGTASKPRRSRKDSSAVSESDGRSGGSGAAEQGAPQQCSSPDTTESRLETERNIVAAYATILLGCLIRDHDFNKRALMDALPANQEIAELAQILEDFLKFQEVAGIDIHEQTRECVLSIIGVFSGSGARGLEGIQHSEATQAPVESIIRAVHQTSVASTASAAPTQSLEDPDWLQAASSQSPVSFGYTSAFRSSLLSLSAPLEERERGTVFRERL